MEKPILATTLSGLFIKSDPWKKAHYIWYDEREKELKKQGKEISAINEWKKLLQEDPKKEKKEYFKYVDKVMATLYPEKSEKERTKIARKTYFDSILQYIKENPEVKNNSIINYFKSLKEKYKIALITTNTKSALKKILKLTNLAELFDIIEMSKLEEKDNKKIVFDRFIKNNKNPILYIGGGKKESHNYCSEKNIKCIYANLEGDKDIKDIESVHNVTSSVT